jgi:molybdopterin-guanine dinucleotide biosynthesis protein A
MDHAWAGLRPHVETVITVGRDWPGLARVEDQPAPDLGPLGGLLGALTYAQAQGFDLVLTCGCDTVGLEAEAVSALAPAPAVIDVTVPTDGDVMVSAPAVLLNVTPVPATKLVTLAPPPEMGA